MFPPKLLKCPSDDTELELIEVIKTKQMNEPVFKYRYTKSNLNTGTTLPLPESQLKKSLDNKIFIEL